ncbi:MAG TPA: class I SAM-dependent methyltransferase [Gemmataceae bacterium]|jgi:malonyl-CoA O-methyltransferase
MSDSVDLVPTRAGYDRWAAVYDADPNPLVAIEEPLVAELLGDVGGLALLDLGCGTGRHTIPLAAAGAAVTAVDFSGEMLALARAKPGAAGVAFLRHDLHDPLAFADRSFHRVVCGLVVDHIRDLGGLFGEVRRVLRPGGFAVVSTVHPAMLLRGVQARFTDPATGREVRPESVPHRISDYVLAAARAGLTIDHLGEHAADEELARRTPRAEKYIGWPLLFVMRLVR